MKFSINQQKAIALLGCGTNYRQCCKILGIERAVLWYWRKNPEFQEAVEKEKTRYVTEYREQLDSLKRQAIAKLSDYLNDSSIPMTEKISVCFDCLNMTKSIQINYLKLD